MMLRSIRCARQVWKANRAAAVRIKGFNRMDQSLLLRNRAPTGNENPRIEDENEEEDEEEEKEEDIFRIARRPGLRPAFVDNGPGFMGS